MKSMVKRILTFFLATVVLAGVSAGCSGEHSKTQAEEREAEKTFSKTIHDFEGYQVYNLDEKEDTNFLVYAENVQQLQADGMSNTIQSIDEQTLTYTFSNADASLMSMQPGDVFFLEASPQNPTGAAIKVKSITAEGDTVTVCSEQVVLSDLFYYAEIDTELPLTNLFYDASQLEEGMEISVERTETASASPKVVQLGNDFDWTGNFGNSIVLSDSMNIDLGRSGSAGSGKKSGTFHFKSTDRIVISRIRVQFKYSFEENYFFSDVSYHVEESTSVSVGFEGSWSNGKYGKGKEWPVFFVMIPGTPIGVHGELFELVTLSGSMYGTLEQSSGYDMGTSKTIRNFQASEPEAYCTPTGESSYGAVEIDGKVEVSFGSRLSVGVPFVVNAYLDSSFGARASGTFALAEHETGAAAAEHIHDCRSCLDGDVELFYRAGVGIEADLLNTITGYDLRIRKDLVEEAVKIGDFYASYRPEADNGVECGWGECPYLRWKTTVSVKNDDGKPAEYAYVNVKYPDGRTDKAMTDSSGEATFYLPNGDNLLNCSSQGQRGSAHAVVNKAPTSAKINLERKRQIYIYYHFKDNADAQERDCTDYKEVYSLVSMKYPEAIWIKKDEWMGHTTSNSTTANYPLDGVGEAYDVSVGDVIIYIASGSYEKCAYVDHAAMTVPGTYDDMMFCVGMALLPKIPEKTDDAEAADVFVQASDIPELIWTYQSTVYLRNEIQRNGVHGDTEYLQSADFVCRELIWQGLEYDSTYRIEELGTTWAESRWMDSAPTYGAKTLYEFYLNGARYRAVLSEYAKRAFPYIDLLVKDEWEEKLEEYIPQTENSDVP